MKAESALIKRHLRFVIESGKRDALPKAVIYELSDSVVNRCPDGPATVAFYRASHG